MGDARQAYITTYAKTEETLFRVAGLSRALYALAVEHPVFGTNDPDCEAILSLIVVLSEKAAEAEIDHEAEWNLIVKRRAA